MSDASDLAETGYEEVIRAIDQGGLTWFEVWQPEAFNRLRGAIQDDSPSEDWLAQFNLDLYERTDGRIRAEFASDEEHGINLSAEAGPVVVLKLVRNRGGVSFVVIRPEAEQVIDIFSQRSSIM